MKQAMFRTQKTAMASAIGLVLIVAVAGCDAGDPIAAHIAQLQGRDADARIAAADALRDIGAAGGAAVPDLVTCLKELHPGVRQSARTPSWPTGPSAARSRARGRGATSRASRCTIG